jgi:hypothetical protein
MIAGRCVTLGARSAPRSTPANSGCHICRRVDAGVERGKAALVLDQIEIEVVEAERQRQPPPQDAVGDPDRRAEGRRW